MVTLDWTKLLCVRFDMWSWLAIALSGFISINAANQGRSKQRLLFVLLTLSLMGVKILECTPLSSYQWSILLGLSLAIVAVSLGLKTQNQVLFFISIMTVPLGYSFALWMEVNGGVTWWLLALLLSIAVLLLVLLLPYLVSLFFPVVVMSLVMLQLVWIASQTWLNYPSEAHFYALKGSIALFITIVMYVINRYRAPLPYGHYIVSGGFFIANGFMVASALLS